MGKVQTICCNILVTAFIIPFAVKYGAGTAAETVLECLVNDYLTFIVLLFGLFCVAGNITVEGSLVGSPRVNVILLGIEPFFQAGLERQVHQCFL